MDLHLKEGALSKALGIPEEDNIPITLLLAIKKARIGASIKNPTKVGVREIEVTHDLKAQAVLAHTMKTKWKHSKAQNTKKNTKQKRPEKIKTGCKTGGKPKTRMNKLT